MKKVLFSFIVALAFVANGFGQNAAEPTIKFKPHAYLQLQGGVGHTVGEAKLMDLMSPAAALNLGYKFSPVFGVRIGGAGWQAKGGWVSPAAVYKYNYLQGNVDLTFDIRSLFGGFNPERTFNPYAFVGGGLALGFRNGAASIDTRGYKLPYLWTGKTLFPAGRAGLGVDFRISKNLSLNLEGNANLYSDKFNSKNGGQPDWQFNVMVGFKINLGKTYKKIQPMAVVEPAPAPAPAPVVEPAPVAEPAPAAPVVKEFPVLPAIHFAFDSDAVDTNKYAAELATIIKVLKEFPDANVEILGYTDHKGSNAYNNKLSLRRANAVKKYLVAQGIDEARLKTVGGGKDPKTSGAEALTIQARRAEVKK